MKGWQGNVYLVGAGPGAPGLLTIKGLDCLKSADVVIYDFLASERLLAQAKPGAELIYVGKRAGQHELSQKEINQLLIKKARAGNKVVRLKGGDPFIFGRGGEEAEALAAASVPFEVVPGVTSAIAVPAYAGIPLTHRGFTSSVAFITGHEDPSKRAKPGVDWEHLATGAGTLVLLMGMGNLPAIVQRLIKAGRDPKTPVAVIRWGSTADQETLVATLKTVAQEVEKRGFKPPAIVVVGDVVALREKLNWYETKPLFGKKILVTRTRAQASALSSILESYGADVLELPTIEVVPCRSYRKLDRAIEELPSFHWVIFTSANGVSSFFQRLYGKGGDARRLKDVKVCAIGPATTSALREKGVRPDLVPKEFRAEGIVAELASQVKPGDRALLVRAEKARDLLPRSLKDMGAEVTVAPAYRTVPPRVDVAEVKKLLEQGKVAAVTFTSSSTAINLAGILGPQEFRRLLKGVAVASIGPVTAETVRNLGVESQVVCEEYTIPALVEKMVEYFRPGFSI